MVPAESASQTAIALTASDSSDAVEANREEANPPHEQPADEGQVGLLNRLNLPDLSGLRTWVAHLRRDRQPEEQGQGQRQRQQDVESRGDMPVNEPLRP